MSLIEVPKAGLETVSNGRAYVDQLANKFVVKPKTAHGIGGFVFDYEGETTFKLHAEITDHYAENNVAVQDHIAINPIRLTLRGFVSEVVFKQPAGLVGAIETIQSKLTTVPAYLGKYTPGAVATLQKALTSTQNIVNTIDQSLARVKNIVGFFDNSALGKTAQERAYGKLQGLMVTKQLMFVETPWGTFNDMAIEDLMLVQDELTKTWSDISVSLKRMNFVEVATSTVDFRAGRNATQSSPSTDKGNSKGTPVTTSIAYKLFGGGG